MADSLSMAFLVVLESLSPAERAVFLLHEVFGYEHVQIAEMTGTSAANFRQVLARARRHIDEESRDSRHPARSARRSRGGSSTPPTAASGSRR